jgi:vitamin K-dependent gamma-carboxylase
VLFGLALAISMWRFIANGWIDKLFVRPGFFFKYWGFSWVEPLSGPAMNALVWSLGGLSLCIAAGLMFRLTAPLFALGLIYLQLIDVSTYLNHYYLAALLALLLAASPAHRLWSADAWLARRFWPERARSQTVSTAWLYLFRFQIGLVYFFAGLAKLQSDWLIHAQPLRIWLGASTNLPLVGALFTLPWVPLVMSWCGFLFDTTIVGFLLYGRTRRYAYAVVLAFHTMTRLLFPIGMFPVIMSLGALVFFAPGWPRAVLRLVRRSEPAPRHVPSGATGRLAHCGLVLGAAYCVLQLLLPVRYLAYGGNVLWHEQGMRFSWRVMVRAKGGGTTFLVHSARANHTWHVSPRDYLTAMQENEMSGQPDLILQLAHRIREDFEARGLGPVEVRAESRAALNGRRSAPFVDPRVDLTKVDDNLSPASFILPAPTVSPNHTRPVL